MQNDRLIKQFRLQVKTELNALVIVLQWFEKVSKPLLPEKSFWQCQVALAEGFTNTVRYAHKNLSPTTPIDLEVNFFTNYLEIRIWDWGQPFDLQAKLNLLSQSTEDPLQKESDRGLFFMKELTNDLQYIRLSNHQNCLIMRKKL